MRVFFVFLILFVVPFLGVAQSTQNVRGRIIDAQSSYPLIGATVVVEGTNPLKGSTTDAEGYFKIEGVPVGRITLKASFIGYSERYFSNLLLNAGKELYLEIKLEESLLFSEEVVIEAEDEPAMVQNEMAVVSARGFDVEQTARYAASRNDPARMAANFAGVNGSNDSRNDIVIRGNSPSGVLWRLEGMDIPNPNHFGATGTTGGPVSMLNNNTLANSDFFTAAFPAEYGNAVSGVFDLNLRNGNNETHEFVGQLGFNGFELGAEGPFSKNSRASYLINYRYSMLAFFDVIGISLGTGSAVPYYQDLSVKLDFPTKKMGRFGVFALGGLSNIDLMGSDYDPDGEGSTDLYGNIDQDIEVEGGVGAAGLTHEIFWNSTTSSRLLLGVSGFRDANEVDTLFRDASNYLLRSEDYVSRSFEQLKYTLAFSVNKKFNARNTLLSGIILDNYQLNFRDENLFHADPRGTTNFNGNTALYRAYTSWQHRFNEALSLTAGLYGQYFSYSESASLEPRLGLRYQLSPRHTLSLGASRHSQLQPLQYYFYGTRLDDGTEWKSNQTMDFTISNHLVLGYDFQINTNWRFKAEAYAQALENIPVEPNPSAFSMLNVGGSFNFPAVDSLVNEGLGRNFGLEFTLERFFANNFYAMTTVSLFKSEYQGSDEVWRSTAFDGGYVLNILGGKEFKINEKNTIALDAKLVASGGMRVIPLDIERSTAENRPVYDHGRSYEEQLDDYFRIDFKFTYRMEGKRISQEFGADIQNLTNRQNPFLQTWNRPERRMSVTNQLGIVPIGFYKILF